MRFWQETEKLWLRQIKSVEVLRQFWIQQYVIIEGELKMRCAQCQQRELCTKAKKAPRVLKLRPMAQYQALKAAREK